VSGGRRSTSFKPGKPGGPGRPRKKAEEKATAIAKKAIADVKAAAKECTEDAIKTPKSVMKDESKPAAARVERQTPSSIAAGASPSRP
jgi:hypothetical protein